MLKNVNDDSQEPITMLRSAIRDYLGRVKEREFDLPFLLLLSELGFYDVHYTHGTAEFGKDFVAKRRDDGVEVQYSFQTKAGDINQTAWENRIQHQMMTSIMTKLTHPNFDASIPHKPVLVTTGDLIGNAGNLVRDLNRELAETYSKPPIGVWARENLVDFFVDQGLKGMLRANAQGTVEQGRFLTIHGQSLQGAISARVIETHARHWLVCPINLDRLLQSAIEAELLNQQCVEHGNWYEAVIAHLALIRVLCAAAYTGEAGNVADYYNQAATRLHDFCMTDLAETRQVWEPERNLLNLGPLDAVTYSVQCARVMDIASLAYFTTDQEGPRAEAVAFLEDFIHHEPGCAHPLSDRYAATLVMATLVLCNEGKDGLARDLIRSATVWLCNRYENGTGLAGLGADESDEVRILLGSGFDSLEIACPDASFLASALSDLAAFLGDPDLYRDVVNDIKACDIRAEYTGSRDAGVAFGAAGEQIRYFASVDYEDELSDFSDFRFSDHLTSEEATFRFADALGPPAAIMLMALWRDRYFPKLWPILAPNSRLNCGSHAN